MNKQTKEQQATRIWIKLALLLVIVISTAALLVTHVYITNLQQTIENLRHENAELKEGNEKTQSHIDHQGTDEGSNEVAKDELGMVDPDTIIYEFE